MAFEYGAVFVIEFSESKNGEVGNK